MDPYGCCSCQYGSTYALLSLVVNNRDSYPGIRPLALLEVLLLAFIPCHNVACIGALRYPVANSYLHLRLQGVFVSPQDHFETELIVKTFSKHWWVPDRLSGFLTGVIRIYDVDWRCRRTDYFWLSYFFYSIRILYFVLMCLRRVSKTQRKYFLSMRFQHVLCYRTVLPSVK